MCTKRHHIVKEDEPEWYIENVWIKFRILHFYSPLHYKVEIFAQSNKNDEPWLYLDSQSTVSHIFLAHLSPQSQYQHPPKTEIFRTIFNRMHDRDERSEYYYAGIFMKVRDIHFAEKIRPCNDNDVSFIQDLSHYYMDSREIIDRLKRMASSDAEIVKLLNLGE